MPTHEVSGYISQHFTMVEGVISQRLDGVLHDTGLIHEHMNTCRRKISTYSKKTTDTIRFVFLIYTHLGPWGPGAVENMNGASVTSLIGCRMDPQSQHQFNSRRIIPRSHDPSHRLVRPLFFGYDQFKEVNHGRKWGMFPWLLISKCPTIIR